MKPSAVLRWLLPVGVLAGAAALAWVLVATAPEPQAAPPRRAGIPVETLVVERTRQRIDLHVQGTVEAARRVQLAAQVGGRIVDVSPRLQPGARVAAGERLLAIDPADYRLAVAMRESALAEARAALALEEGRRQVAEREWALFRETFGDAAEPPPLALREPQRAQARARVASAEAALEQARLQLARTRLTAPFDAIVLSESAAVGRQVAPQQPLAELVGAAVFRVRAAVPVEELPFVEIPGAAAVVRHDLGDRARRFDGRVVRLEGSVAPGSRMAQLLVEVPHPFGRAGAAPEVPLLLDAYVDVAIAGAREHEVVVVPRRALHAGNRVWLFEPDGEAQRDGDDSDGAAGRLRLREVEVLWEREREVLVRRGLDGGERLVASPIGTPVDGMALRRADAGADAAQRP